MAGRHIIRRGFAIPPRNRGWTNTSEFAQEAILINDGEEMIPAGWHCRDRKCVPLASPVLFLSGALTRHWTTIVPNSLMAFLACDPCPAFNRHKGESLALPVAF